MAEAHVVVSGNVGAEVSWRVADDISRAWFSVASTPRVRRDGEWRDGQTTWYQVTCWRRLADRVRDSIRRGQPVLVGGRLTTRRFVNRHGVEGEEFAIEADWVGHDLRWGNSSFTRMRQDQSEAPGFVTRGDENDRIGDADADTHFREAPEPEGVGEPEGPVNGEPWGSNSASVAEAFAHAMPVGATDGEEVDA